MRRLRLCLLVVCGLTALPALAKPPKSAAAKKKPAAAAVESGKKKKPADLNLRAPDAAAESAPSASATAGSAPSRGPTRIDFDDRLIQGQTNKSGAVYLYDRKELKTRSMIKKRESFREEIVSSVYDGE